MKIERKILGTIAMVLMCAACAANDPQELRQPEMVAERTLESLGIAHEQVSAPDTPPQIAEGLYRLRDGFALTDNVGKKLVILDANFETTSVLNYEGIAYGATGIDEYGEDLTVLDAYAPKPTLITFRNGAVIAKVELGAKADTLPTGMLRDDLGLLIEYENGISARRVSANGSISNSDADGFQFAGTRYALGVIDKARPHERTLRVNGTDVTLRTPNYLGTARILRGSASGVSVLVEDVTFGETIQVSQSVWNVGPDGKITDISAIPAQESGFYVRHGIAVLEDNTSLVLTAKPGLLQFWRTRESTPESMLNLRTQPIGDLGGYRTDEIGVVAQGLITYSGSCLSQSNMTSNVNEYLNTSVSMTSANINNPASCGTRQKPNYLGSPGTYYSVSYDWGGWDTPSQFTSAMSSGAKAGNLNTGSGLSCTYGVDCSGFITRVWGFTNFKRSTATLLNADTSTVAYGPGYYTGDAFVLPSVHAVLYVSTGGNGFNLWESAGEPYGKVVSRNSAWSYVSGYSSRHSITHCNY